VIEITERLDKIASSLESKGLLKEAESVDVISNTIENLGYDYFVKKAFLRRKNADLYSRIVSAKEALKNGKWKKAYDIISESMNEMKERAKLSRGDSAISSYINLFNKVVKAFIEENQSPGYIIRLLDGVLYYMKESEKDTSGTNTEPEPFGAFIPARNSEYSLAKS